MKLCRLLLLAFFTTTTALAQVPLKKMEHPKLLPFHYDLHANEMVTVDYDFSEKLGIRCRGDQGLKINFSYKGREKTAALPVMLVAHLPDKPHQELMDIQGHFSIYLVKESHHQKKHVYALQCEYIEQ